MEQEDPAAAAAAAADGGNTSRPRRCSAEKKRKAELPAGGGAYCTVCGKVLATKQTMIQHHRAQHLGIRYPCDQCDYQATQKNHLKKHKEAKHRLLKCEYCPFQTMRRQTLTLHKKNSYCSHVHRPGGS